MRKTLLWRCRRRDADRCWHTIFRRGRNIGNVAQRVDEGLKAIYDSRDCVIVNIDSSSADGTSAVFEATPTQSRKVILNTPRGKGRAMLAFFEFCVANGIECCATVDADLTSISTHQARRNGRNKRRGRASVRL